MKLCLLLILLNLRAKTWIYVKHDVVFQEEPVEPGSCSRAPLVDEGVPPLNKDQQRQDGLGG